MLLIVSDFATSEHNFLIVNDNNTVLGKKKTNSPRQDAKLSALSSNAWFDFPPACNNLLLDTDSDTYSAATAEIQVDRRGRHEKVQNHLQASFEQGDLMSTNFLNSQKTNIIAIF